MYINYKPLRWHWYAMVVKLPLGKEPPANEKKEALYIFGGNRQRAIGILKTGVRGIYKYEHKTNTFQQRPCWKYQATAWNEDQVPGKANTGCFLWRISFTWWEFWKAAASYKAINAVGYRNGIPRSTPGLFTFPKSPCKIAIALDWVELTYAGTCYPKAQMHRSGPVIALLTLEGCRSQSVASSKSITVPWETDGKNDGSACGIGDGTWYHSSALPQFYTLPAHAPQHP